MMNLNIKHVDRACLIIVVMVSLVCGYLSISQILKKSQQYEIEKDIFSKRMKEVNLASTNLEDQKAALDETKRELDYLNERIPESGKIGLLLKQINSLMKQRQIALISLRPLTIREEKVYLKNPIQLSLIGNFVDIYHLIHDLENMNRIVVMEQVTISKQERTDKCQVELIINVFEHKKTI
jgi:type IV pilus assembly protein PilO